MAPQANPERRAGLPLGELIRLLEARGLLRSAQLGRSNSPAATVLQAVTLDSRAVRPGSLFVAVPGSRVDGHDFVADAVAAGASAVVAERVTPLLGVAQLLVPAARPAPALVAAALHGFPSHELGVIGVTGTDGKTTTSFLLRSVLAASGVTCGLVGTIETSAGGRVISRGRQTTPEAPELQAALAAMLAAGDRFAVVESTSHGLAQERVGEVAYDVAVLTNLAHEHLEFHRTPEAYLAAKRGLFERLAVGEANPEKGRGKWALLNIYEPAAAEFGSAAARAGARRLSYGTSAAADVRALRIEEHAAGLRVLMRAPRWDVSVSLQLAGLFNAHNALAAAAVGEVLGLPEEGIRRGLEGLAGVPGRMQRVHAGQPFNVVVDYAHTADSLAKVLDNLAPLAAAGGGGLLAVFGSAGERDTLKRPMMGRVAGERCRLVVLTDEDPRGEDRLAILEEIAAGAEQLGRRRGHDLLLIPDRGEAIAAALEQARPGDVVVLCGKGHEQTIETAQGAVEWDEVEAVRAALAGLGYGS
ncbi:UDP-N-acetylmuramoyl-L-alanyl-D-glutamate--2,6-diaminopimelate ligase [soil metagenome]